MANRENVGKGSQSNATQNGLNDYVTESHESDSSDDGDSSNSSSDSLSDDEDQTGKNDLVTDSDESDFSDDGDSSNSSSDSLSEDSQIGLKDFVTESHESDLSDDDDDSSSSSDALSEDDAHNTSKNGFTGPLHKVDKCNVSEYMHMKKALEALNNMKLKRDYQTISIKIRADQMKEFTVRCRFEEKEYFGTGSSQREAKSRASQQLFHRMICRGDPRLRTLPLFNSVADDISVFDYITILAKHIYVLRQEPPIEEPPASLLSESGGASTAMHSARVTIDEVEYVGQAHLFGDVRLDLRRRILMSVMGVQARPEIGAPDKMIAAMSLDASTKKTNPPSAQNDNGQRRPGRDARLPDGDLRHLLRAREGRNERDEHWAGASGSRRDRSPARSPHQRRDSRERHRDQWVREQRRRDSTHPHYSREHSQSQEDRYQPRRYSSDRHTDERYQGQHNVEQHTRRRFGVCFKFRDTGRCAYGAHCKYTH